MKPSNSSWWHPPRSKSVSWWTDQKSDTCSCTRTPTPAWISPRKVELQCRAVNPILFQEWKTQNICLENPFISRVGLCLCFCLFDMILICTRNIFEHMTPQIFFVKNLKNVRCTCDYWVSVSVHDVKICLLINKANNETVLTWRCYALRHITQLWCFCLVVDDDDRQSVQWVNEGDFKMLLNPKIQDLGFN